MDCEDCDTYNYNKPNKNTQTDGSDIHVNCAFHGCERPVFDGHLMV